MPPFIDLTGKRFGRLTVKARVGTTAYGQPQWKCSCDCGNGTTVFGNALRQGVTTSCGCVQREAVTTHGKTGTPEFTVWQMMIQRCTNPRHNSYARYGGRGIRVCPRWLAFKAFIADMGQRPSEKHTIDRIDNNRGYSPENCRWATPREQGANRSTTRPLTFRGETLPRAEWCRRLGIKKSTLDYRLRRGLSVHEALTPR